MEQTFRMTGLCAMRIDSAKNLYGALELNALLSVRDVELA